MVKVVHTPVQIRWPNEEKGGWFRIPGLIVAENVALVLFDENLEVHLVEPSREPNEYELRFASHPMFYVGNDLETVLHDLQRLTIVEFAAKYTHSDFADPRRRI